MVAAYRRAKNFNPVEIKKTEKSGDTRRCALPRGATLQRAAPRGTANGYKSGAARWSIAGPLCSPALLKQLGHLGCIFRVLIYTHCNARKQSQFSMKYIFFFVLLNICKT